MRRSTQPMMPRFGPPWRRKTAHKAGDKVSALIAEIAIATLIVTANCRNNVPDTPGIKAIGTNTENNTRVMAMIGAVISAIAFFVASPGVRSGSSSITRSTFSTTTIASSTRMPIASTIASSDTVLTEYPIASSTAKVPITLTGTAIAGMMVARRLPRNKKTTSTTRPNAITSVSSTSWIVARAKDDVAELLGGRQATLRLNVELKLLVFADRACPNAPDGRLNILGLDCGNDVGRRQLQVIQPLRVEPDPHGIVERPEDARLPDARQSRQHVHDVDDRVVGDEQRVLLPVVAIEREELQDRR